VSAGARVERVVRGVCAAAMTDASAAGIVVLEDWTPEGELLYEWLVRELGERRVWRAASLASNLQAGGSVDAGLAAAWRAARDDDALVAHPANRTALLLGGRLPWADLLPFGDVPASHVEALAGRWSASADVEALAAAAGGITVLDAALERLVDRREPSDAALAGLDGTVAQQVLRLYERGRPFRLRARLVPKLGARTIGIDLFD
jgi:hypothetical protein